MGRVLIGVALVLGLAVAVGSVSCPLFASSFAAGPPPRPATPFRTRRMVVSLAAFGKHLQQR